MHLEILICDWDQISLIWLIFRFPHSLTLRTTNRGLRPQQLNLQMEFVGR